MVPVLVVLSLAFAPTPSVAALIGVDFGSGSNAPPSWNNVTAGNQTINNLIDESGAATGINLQLGPGLTFSTPVNAGTIPTHTTSLANIGGNFYSTTDDFEGTFSNLLASTDYFVWVFGLRNDAAQSQTVTISDGDVSSINFNQTGPRRDLFVNSALGSSAASLQSYAVSVTSSSTGTIDIGVAKSGTTLYGVAGLAIQAVPIPSALLLFLSALGVGFVAHRRPFGRRG